MKKWVWNVFFALLAFVQMASATSLKSEQKEAAEFIQRLYSYSLNMFEAGEFKGGQHDPKKSCKLRAEFFSPNLLTQPDDRQGCQIKGMAFIRYPAFNGSEFDVYGAPGTIKKPKITVLNVEGEKSSVAVTTEFGRTVFFLTKTDKGLRVENALYYERWPLMDEKCWSMFLAPPNAWHKKAEQAVCNK